MISSIDRKKIQIENDLRWGVYIVIKAQNNYVKNCFKEYGMVTDSSGEYSANSTTGLEQDTLKKWFFKDKQGDNYKVKPELKKMIHFKRLNLLQMNLFKKQTGHLLKRSYQSSSTQKPSSVPNASCHLPQ